MGERQKLAEKRPIFRQSIDTRKLSTQAPELLACIRQNRFVYDTRVFDRHVASSLTGIQIKEKKTANRVVFLSSFTAKDHSLRLSSC